MPPPDRRRLWYKDAVIYALDVGTYMDSDDDGVGDFQGLRSRLDYIASLGVTCLWLLPCFPTPNRDNGYDITDYYSVDPRLGSLGDFVVFMHEATSRGLRVLLDLVVHHTSDQHPWFQEARADPASPYRDHYLWADSPPDHSSAKVMFPGIQESIWTFDAEAGACYLHQFYAFEPDLNITDPAVRAEIEKIVSLWLELGVSGFRVDAASHMLGAQALEPQAEEQPHEFLRSLRDIVSAAEGDPVLLAESDVEPDRLATYFGAGDEMQMLYNFLLDNYLVLALAREEAEPLARGLGLLPDKPATGQWVNFLRNLDELDLERLTEGERQEVYAAFAPDEEMRVYGRGIRRRLAPMLGGDRRRLELAYSLLFSLPGTPMLVYGDEIGMGDDLSLPERWSVRTPMQWSDEANGGFSTAPQEQLVLPVIDEGPFGYTQVNVVDQWRDGDSLLTWMHRLVYLRRQNPEIGQGELQIIETDDDAVFAHRCDWGDGAVLTLHNLGAEPRTVSLGGGEDLPEPVVEIFGDQAYEPVTGDDRAIRVDGYGYRWFRCGGVRL